MLKFWNLRKERTKLLKFSALFSVGLIFALVFAVYAVLGGIQQKKNNETGAAYSQNSIGERLLKSVSKKKKKKVKKAEEIKTVAGSTFVASSSLTSSPPLSCPGDSQLMWNGQRFYCLAKTDHYSLSVAVTGDATKTITIARNGTTDISTIFVDKDTDTFCSYIIFRHIEVAVSVTGSPRVLGYVVFCTVLIFTDTGNMHQVVIGRGKILYAGLSALLCYRSFNYSFFSIF